MRIGIKRAASGFALLVMAIGFLMQSIKTREDQHVKALPSSVKLGQVYRSLRDVEVLGSVGYRGAASSGFKCTLPANTRIVVTNNPPLGAEGVWALPLNYKALEQQLVPRDKLSSPSYGDYGVSIALFQLSKFFVLEHSVPIVFDDEEVQRQWELILKHSAAQQSS